MQWAYGITTVPARRRPLFEASLRSLATAGFDQPRLFIDGATLEQETAYAMDLGLPITARRPAGSIVINWILSMWELFLRDPDADRYALFQDDICVVRNLRTYLETSPYPTPGYCNLCTYPFNAVLADGHTGWYRSNQRGLGAQALVFDRTAVIALLIHRHLIDRLYEKQLRRLRSIDGGIVTSLKNVGHKEYVHYPSLVDHIGHTSTMNKQPQPAITCFPGEEFDALSLGVTTIRN